MAIRLVPPRATYEECFKTLQLTTSRRLSNIIRIIVETSTELSIQAHNQFFRAGEVSWDKGTLISISSTTNERKALQGKLSEFFSPRYS